MFSGLSEMEVTLIECGSTMEKSGFSKESYGNTCFFNSLRFELERVKHQASKWTYEKFLQAGEFPRETQGRMIDTERHESQIQRLASILKIRIDVYTEVKSQRYHGRPGVYRQGQAEGHFVHADLISIFGLDGPTVLICKVLGALHYNAFTWSGSYSKTLSREERVRHFELLRAVRESGSEPRTASVKKLVEPVWGPSMRGDRDLHEEKKREQSIWNKKAAVEELERKAMLRRQEDADRLFAVKLQENQEHEAKKLTKEKKQLLEMRHLAERHMVEIEAINARQRLEMKQMAARHAME